MSHRKLWLRVLSIISMAALVLGQGAAPVTLAQGGGPAGSPHARPVFNSGADTVALPRSLQADANGKVKIVIELQDNPTVRVYADTLNSGIALQDLSASERVAREAQATTAAQTQLNRIQVKQQTLEASLAAVQATTIYRVQRAYNGIAVLVDQKQLSQIQAMPGVKAIHPLVTKQLDNATSNILIGGQTSWSKYQATGANITVGVIDTGIDYRHTDFGGDGAVFTDTSPYTVTNLGSGADFPTAKVVGGWDFAGDNYDADPTDTTYNPIPSPDPNPMDCAGHGSHVAGTIAGVGVTSAGTAFTGDYTLLTEADIKAMRIGPGMAPEASLYSLRVFGCNGSTDLTTPAIEWAMDPNQDGNFADHLDVINMSLGSSYGGADDDSAVASDNAALAGVVVVASAGNSYDGYYIVGSPSTSSRTISVASSVDNTDVMDAFRVTHSAIDGMYPGLESALFDWAADPSIPLTATLVYPEAGVDLSQNQQSGCYTFNITNTTAIAGHIVLLDWTDDGCGGSILRAGNAYAAGAVGVLIADNSDIFDLSINGSDVIPAQSIQKSVGNELKANLPLSVTFSHEFATSYINTDQTMQDTLSTFSSRGPRADNILKPDVAAPGQTIFSVAALSGNKGVSFNGTSMAAPHVAGLVAAFLSNPDSNLPATVTVEQIKALVMNNATHDMRSGTATDTQIYAPSRIGAGRVDLGAMLANDSQLGDMIAYNLSNPELVSVSFGKPEVVAPTTLTKVVKVQSLSKTHAPPMYAKYMGVTSMPGVTVTVGATQAQVNDTLQVSLEAVPSQMRTRSSDTTIVRNSEREFMGETSGYLTFVSATSGNFTATLSSANLVPPVSLATTGAVSFTYNATTGNLDYDALITPTGTISLTSMKLYIGYPGVAGGDSLAIFNYAGGNPINSATHDTGSLTISTWPAYEEALVTNNLYVQVATIANPAGEVRGQVLSRYPVLRVPIYAAPRPASAMYAETSTIATNADHLLTTIALTGTDLSTGSWPVDTLSLVTGLELQEIGVQGPTAYKPADLEYVGVGSDHWGQGSLADTEIFFGLSTYGNWSNPSPAVAEFDVFIDTNRDGHWDFVLYNGQIGSLSNGPGESIDTYVSRLYNLNAKTGRWQDYINYYGGETDTALFGSNAMVLSAYASDLGLSSAGARFDYQVVTWDNAGNMADASAVHTYDPLSPGLDLSGGYKGIPMYNDFAGDTLPVLFDRTYYDLDQALGVLLLHHHNQSSYRAEIVTITAAPLYYVYAPLLLRR
jgi:subtilisin family serine protease